MRRIRVSSIAKAVAEKIERENGKDDEKDGHQHPGVIGDDLELHTFLEHDPPAYDGGSEAEREKAQGRFTEDHGGNTEG